MRTFLYKSLLLIVLAATLGSCSKWLELRPADGIVGDDYWKTKEQLKAAVTGIYASMTGLPSGVSDRLQVEYFFMWGELRADMVMPTTNAGNEDIDIYNVNLLSTNSIVSWRSLYRTINYCNTVIANAPDVTANDPTLTQEQLNNYLSEAYAIRALMYFYLARSFGDVPLKLTATTSDDDLVQLPKTPQAEVLKQVLADLAKAEPIAVLTFGDRAADKGKITRYTINAIQADVYLWMEKYTECIAACDKIISSGKFGLLNASNFSNLFANGGNTNESIFELQFDAQAQNPFVGMFTNSRRRYQITPAVMETIYTVDYVNSDSIDYRGALWVNSGANAIVKYAINATADASYNHWMMYRYADVLLMKAEALNQTGAGRQALDILYTVRRRSHALEQTDLNPSEEDTDGIADFILQERGREFAFEGKRWYDILRNAKRENYRRLNQVLLSMVISTVPPERQQTALNKYRDFNSHYFPIHIYEIQTDKNLVQNPFYQ